MYDTIWQLIQSGDYSLTDLAGKINVLWVEGQLTQDERDTLISLAQEGANPDQEALSLAEQITYLSGLITDLTTRVDALEADGGDSGGDGGDSGGETTTYEEWVQPIAGLTTNYQYGAIVSHNGVLYISKYSGQNVWEPGVVGTEALWVVYTEE